MGERQPNAGIDLFDDDVLAQVRPDPPVVLAEDLVVHEAAPGPLEHRVVDEQQEPAAAAPAPAPPRPSTASGSDGVLDHQAADDPVERAVSEREALAHPSDVHSARRLLAAMALASWAG